MACEEEKSEVVKALEVGDFLGDVFSFAGLVRTLCEKPKSDERRT